MLIIKDLDSDASKHLAAKQCAETFDWRCQLTSMSILRCLVLSIFVSYAGNSALSM